MYLVKEIFLTLQGEGVNTGKRAVFVRFSGCNLWSGREKDRVTAICRFCDTDFVGVNGKNGGKYRTAFDILDTVNTLWGNNDRNRFVVLTGGEPGLQLDKCLIDEFHLNNYRVAIETNGTVKLPANIDWVCLSPKVSSRVVLQNCNELKVVYPQEHIQLDSYTDIITDNRWLSPMDGHLVKENIKKCIDYCLKHPEWRLNIQAHKIWNID